MRKVEKLPASCTSTTWWRLIRRRSAGGLVQHSYVLWASGSLIFGFFSS